MTKLALVLLLISGALFAQKSDSTSTSITDKVFAFVEQPPEFVGGRDALTRYLAANLKYPEEARKAKIEGKAFVQFVIETDGTVTNAQIVKGINYQLDQAALRVIRNMPNWSPGKQGGKVVRTQFVLPIRFNISQ